MSFEPKISQDYLKQRMQQIAKQKAENSRYIQLKNGENQIQIDLTVLPTEQPPKNGFGARMIYTTTAKRELKNPKTQKVESTALLLSASQILDALIIKALSAGFNPFTLIKVGEGINTRYAIKELENSNS